MDDQVIEWTPLVCRLGPGLLPDHVPGELHQTVPQHIILREFVAALGDAGRTYVLPGLVGNRGGEHARDGALELALLEGLHPHRQGIAPERIGLVDVFGALPRAHEPRVRGIHQHIRVACVRHLPSEVPSIQNLSPGQPAPATVPSNEC